MFVFVKFVRPEMCYGYDNRCVCVARSRQATSTFISNTGGDAKSNVKYLATLASTRLAYNLISLAWQTCVLLQHTIIHKHNIYSQ